MNVNTIGIACSPLRDSGFAKKRSPSEIAKTVLALVIEEKIEAPAVVFLTANEVLVIPATPLMSSIDNYTVYLKNMVAKEKPWAVAQAVWAVLSSGEDPILHLRVEANNDNLFQTYGVVVRGWSFKEDKTVGVMAESEADYDLATPYLLRPALMLAPLDNPVQPG